VHRGYAVVWADLRERVTTRDPSGRRDCEVIPISAKRSQLKSSSHAAKRAGPESVVLYAEESFTFADFDLDFWPHDANLSYLTKESWVRIATQHSLTAPTEEPYPARFHTARSP